MRVGKFLFLFAGFCAFFGAVYSAVAAPEPYTLNVVYFLPSDMEPVADYEARLSALLLHTQRFYGDEMKRNGFGQRTFGLRMKSKELVDIVVVRGQHEKERYGYEGGGGRANGEIERYFREHPDARGSQHTLVFMASTTEDPYAPGGVPFYGLGRICFALDYPLFDIKYLGKESREGRLLTKWFGGMAHELGHGLNLPHNMETVSDRKEHGTALMGSGNYTFGQQPTFLTKASCAILSNCEVFATKDAPYYRDAPRVDVRGVSIRFDKNDISLDVAFESSIPVSAVNVYIDGAPYGNVANDYDAVSFSFVPQGERLRGRIESEELHDASITDFQVRMVYLHINGRTTTMNYSFARPKPVDFVWREKEELPKAGWKARASTEEFDGRATMVLDDDPSTFWHSQWRGGKPGYPHEIEVVLPRITAVTGVSFLQRDTLHGALKEIEIEVRSGDTWHRAGRYTLQPSSQKQYIDLPKPVRIEAVRITAYSSHTVNDPQIASMAEIGLY